MEILEIVGESIAANDAELGRALRRVEETVKAQKAKDTSADEKQRIRDIIALCFEYDREEDKDERPGIEDDRLRLIFTCCHPALAPDAQVALTLREVCGLKTEEIAHAFLTPAPTLAQRIVRAKNKIRDTLSFVSVIGSDGSNL